MGVRCICYILLYFVIVTLGWQDSSSHRSRLMETLGVKLRIFSYVSVYTFVLDAQKNCLIETVLLSTQNICFG